MLGIPEKTAALELRQRPRSHRSSPRSSRSRVPCRSSSMILEHREDYPGVNVDRVDDPRVSATTASPSQLLGYVGEIGSSDQLEAAEGPRATRPATSSVATAWKPRTSRSCAASRAGRRCEIDPTGNQVGAPLRDPAGHGRQQRPAHDRHQRATGGGARARGRHRRPRTRCRTRATAKVKGYSRR